MKSYKNLHLEIIMCKECNRIKCPLFNQKVFNYVIIVEFEYLNKLMVITNPIWWTFENEFLLKAISRIFLASLTFLFDL